MAHTHKFFEHKNAKTQKCKGVSAEHQAGLGYAERRSISMMGHQKAKFVEFWQKMTLVTAATRKNLYTPPDAWYGKIYGMAWQEIFSRHAKKQGIHH